MHLIGLSALEGMESERPFGFLPLEGNNNVNWAIFTGKRHYDVCHRG